MSDISMTFEQLKDRPVNYVSVEVGTESGCNIEDDEYSLHITGFLGALDIGIPGGVDDISLIKECVLENLDAIDFPEEGSTQLILRESGEWEDVFWHKYYELERWSVSCDLTPRSKPAGGGRRKIKRAANYRTLQPVESCINCKNKAVVDGFRCEKLGIPIRTRKVCDYYEAEAGE